MRISRRRVAKALSMLVLVSEGAQAVAVDNDCERPFTLDEAVTISQSFQGPTDLVQCKRDLGGRVTDNTELAAAEIMGMLGIYTVSCGRPAGATNVTQVIEHIVSEAVADGGDRTKTSLREVIAVRVYECVAEDR